MVLPEDDALSEKITKMIASLDSVESLCDFSYLEHDEAFQKMKSGELQAVFEVPSGMARGILDGTNQPATIWFPDERAGRRCFPGTGRVGQFDAWHFAGGDLRGK